jgi:2-polyprenyl-6-methoxyphenol hydroxylase-like FAD-dependent oxidoreductase
MSADHRRMAHIIVLGAGLNGLATALLLARDGHTVTVLERDPAEPSAGTEWETWARPGVSQFRFAHIMLPLWHVQMRAELPDVLAALADAGGTRLNFADMLPPLSRGERRPDDDRFDTITARRPVLESAFARCAADLDIRRGVNVAGFEIEGERVVGVRTREGAVLRADLVVDCTGRNSALPAVDEREDAGFVYFGRHFRGKPPVALGPLLQHYESVSLLTLPCDNDTWAVAFVASSRDHELRVLRDADRWAAALDRYPLAAPWRDGEPLTGVDVMAGLDDRRRRYRMPGVVAVGDAAYCTNPSLGRGASIGLRHALLLRDTLRETAVPDVSGRFADRSAEVVEPLYQSTLWFDRHRIAEIDADLAGVPYAPDDQRWAVARKVYAAALTDPDAARAQLRLGGLLASGDDVLGDRAQVGRFLAVAEGMSRYPLPGPGRAELLSAVRSAPQPV